MRRSKKSVNIKKTNSRPRDQSEPAVASPARITPSLFSLEQAL
jgi:hypothetical protein